MAEQGVTFRARRVPYLWAGLGIAALGLLALVVVNDPAPEAWWVPGLVTALGGLVLLPVLARAFRLPVTEALSDHLLVFSGAFLVYFVFGALLLPLGPQAQIEHVLSYYPTDAAGALRVTGVNFVGFGIALITGALITRRGTRALADRALIVGSRLPEYWVIAAFLVLGELASAVVQTADLGLHPVLVSGVVRSASRFSLVAVFIAASYRGRRERALRFASVAVAVVESTMGLLLFNKSAVLLPLVALAAGLGWRYGLRRVAVPSLAVLVVTFLWIGGATANARNRFVQTEGAGLQERAATLRAGVEPDSAYAPWARFCYVAPQTAALDFYDAGNGGDDIGKFAWVFVPRLLFPEKPVMTQTGVDFHFKISGGETSSTGQGIFVNGYYNLGWAGVLLFGVLAGALLAQTSAFAHDVLERRALPWIPFALLGANMAFRIDGAFLADIWGPFAMLLYAIGAGALLGASGRSAAGGRG